MTDERRIGVDCDVLIGTWPPRAQIAMDPDSVAGSLERSGIDRALVCSSRGAWFDDIEGNTETIDAAAARPSWTAVGTINTRNARRAEDELDRLESAGVQAIRLFANQGASPRFPGYQHIVVEAVRRGFVILAEGDVREFWTAYADLGARVVFLDVHAYHVADFVVLATREPHFVASTRLLNAPDSIETVVGEVGAQHLAFGTRTPLHAASPATIRMRRARISDDDWTAVTGGTITRLLEGAST